MPGITNGRAGASPLCGNVLAYQYACLPSPTVRKQILSANLTCLTFSNLQAVIQSHLSPSCPRISSPPPHTTVRPQITGFMIFSPSPPCQVPCTPRQMHHSIPTPWHRLQVKPVTPMSHPTVSGTYRFAPNMNSGMYRCHGQRIAS